MTKGKLLAVCLLWLMVLGIGAAVWKLYLDPAREKQRLDETSADSRYRHHIDFALDSFSGYAVFRSQDFRDELSKKRIKVNLVDDGADYSQRIEALQSGEIQLAAFTIDALIKASAELGELPATIVALIDETRGADAMVAYKKAVPNVDALNDPKTKFVLTPDSPSETLARVVVAHFQLDALESDPFVRAADAEDVYKRYRKSDPDTHQAFVLWEPYVSKVLENPNTHVVVDSSRFRRCIRAITSPPLCESRLPVGSSARISAGSLASARAIATRCRCPPESWLGKCLIRSPSPTISSNSMLFFRRLPRLPGCPIMGTWMFSSAFRVGIRL